MRVEYIILEVNNYSEKEIAAFDAFCTTTVKNSRHNKGNTKCIIKYEGDTPSILSKHTSYNKLEVTKVLQASEWVIVDERA